MLKQQVDRERHSGNKVPRIAKGFQMQCPKCKKIMHRKRGACPGCNTNMMGHKDYIDTRRKCEKCGARVGTRKLTCDCGADLSSPVASIQIPLPIESRYPIDSKTKPMVAEHPHWDAVDINSFLPGSWECASFRMHNKSHILASSPDYKDGKLESYSSIYEMLLAIFAAESKKKKPSPKSQKGSGVFSATFREVLPEAWKISRKNFAGKEIYIAMAVESAISYINYPDPYLCDPDPAALIHKIWIQEVDRNKRLEESKKERKEAGLS